MFFFFFKQKTAYEIGVRLVGSEMCIRDSLGIVGGVLTKKMPDFDPRNYGYKKLSLLVKSLSKIVEIEERPSENGELKLVYVRNRTR